MRILVLTIIGLSMVISNPLLSASKKESKKEYKKRKIQLSVLKRRKENTQNAKLQGELCLNSLDQIPNELQIQWSKFDNDVTISDDLKTLINREKQLSEKYYAIIDRCKILSGKPAQIRELNKTIQKLTIKKDGSPKDRCVGKKNHKEGRQYIMDTLQKMGLTTEINNAPSRFRIVGKRIKNIVARLNDSEPSKRCLVLSAHYDSHCKQAGANDNAAGVATLIETARVLKEENLQSDLDIYFTFPDQEENYLAGSPKLVKFLRKKKCDKIIANINLDIVGDKFFKGMENKMIVMGTESSHDLANIVFHSNHDGIDFIESGIYLIEPLGTLVPRSDYASFRKKKIPFVFYSGGTPKYYHTKQDTEDKVDYPFLRNFTDHLVNVVKNVSQNSTLSFEFSKKREYKEEHGKNMIMFLEKFLNNDNEMLLKHRKVLEKRLRNLRRKMATGESITKGYLQRTILAILITVKAKNHPVNNAIMRAL